MISEGQIIPYRVSEPPEGPWLVFAPHADDETFGMGGTLLRARRSGIEVAIGVMTDGALGGPRAGLEQLRRDEIRGVADRLGIDRLLFLGEPDRGLKVSVELSCKLAGLIESAGAATVFFPGVSEPHPDHRATTLLLWQALQGMSAQSRPRAAAYEISVQSPVNLLVDISADVDAKRELMAVYESQMEENNYADIVLALNRLRTFSLPPEVTHAEGFYLFGQEDLELSLAELMSGRLGRMLSP